MHSNNLSQLFTKIKTVMTNIFLAAVVVPVPCDNDT